jgi:hypothetical protein
MRSLFGRSAPSAVRRQGNSHSGGHTGMGNEYTAANAAWRDNIFALTERLSDEDIARVAGGPSWTVGVALCHLAFWDHRASVLLKKWKAGGIADSPNDIDVVNDSMLPFLKAIPPAEVRRLVREAAEGIDAEIDSLAPDFLARVESDGRPVRLDRSKHREHHAAQIEKAMGW